MPLAHGYRSDIDGLRALAVLPVILFHAMPASLAGGFLGVDVFFVISGFLITSNISASVRGGTFDLAEFYRRRIARLFPMMILVTVFTVVAAQQLMVHSDAENVAESGIWALFSASNFYYLLNVDTSYFAPKSSELPLLHLWSLGVEEQFYLIWPSLFLILAPLAKRHWYSLLIAVALASFASAELFIDSNPMLAYYMLPFRVGELLAGAVLAMALPGMTGSNLLAASVSVAGIVLLACGYMLIDEASRFPGMLAMVPTFATIALLLGGGIAPANPVSRLLSIFPLRWVGLVSYSAYLWHWPLMAGYRYAYGEPDTVAALVLVTATLAIAALSYRIVETPLRRTTLSFSRVLMLYFLAPVLCMAAVFQGMLYLDGHGLRRLSSEYRDDLASARAQTIRSWQTEAVCQFQTLRVDALGFDRCASNGAAVKARVLLYGDSTAAHVVPLFSSISTSSSFGIQNLSIGSCPPIVGDPGAFVTAGRRADCRAASAKLATVFGAYDVLVLSALWPDYVDRGPDFLESLFSTVRAQVEAGRLVVLVSSVPPVSGFDPECIRKRVSIPGLECAAVTAVASERVQRVNAALRDFAQQTDGVVFFDIVDDVCEGGICRSHADDGRPIYTDFLHLHPDGARIVAQKIVASGEHSALLREIEQHLVDRVAARRGDG